MLARMGGGLDLAVDWLLRVKCSNGNSQFPGLGSSRGRQAVRTGGEDG